MVPDEWAWALAPRGRIYRLPRRSAGHDGARPYCTAVVDPLVLPPKELELEDVERYYPADHYLLIDDKVRWTEPLKAA